MELNLAGKKALILGASRGLGAEICRQLASEHVQIIAVARTQTALVILQQELMNIIPLDHSWAAIDIMSDGGVEEISSFVESQIGVPDIIVHNIGGTLGIRDSLAPAYDYQHVWQLNLGGAIDINDRFLPGMQKQGWGRIIHVSSSASVKVDASLPYCAAKAALNAYVVGVGRAVAQKGVVVCAVLPGPFQYEGSQWELRSREQPEVYRQFIETRMPLGRLGKTEDIAGIITFLASDRGSFFSGVLVPADGGMR